MSPPNQKSNQKLKASQDFTNSDFKKATLALGDWFERTSRVLPWREDPSPYRVWISEIMLQQTQVVTVVPYFERFLKRFPRVESLAAATEDDVLLNWAGLGYYSRARNIHEAAKRIVAQGGFPESREQWIELPGVGPYTAGAISSIAFDQAEPILDGNVERVVSRVRTLDRRGGDAAYKAKLWALSKIAVENAQNWGVRPRVFNQALMELGAVVCTPKSPKCGVCPVAAFCRARATDQVDSFPPAKAKKAWLEVQEQLVALFDSRGEKVLMRKRARGEWRAGLWDFPEAKDLVVKKWIKQGELLGDIESKHVVTRHKITRTTKVITLESLPKGIPEGDWQWVSRRDPHVALGSAPQKVLKLLGERYWSET